VDITETYPAAQVEDAAPLVALLRRAIQTCGLHPTTAATGGGSDANNLNAAGISAVNVGMGFRQPHTLEEHIAVADLASASRVALAVMTTERGGRGARA
jgi:tripeptide aminopeptidase